MPVYEYECGSSKCLEDNGGKPREFTHNMPLKDYDKSPTCARCDTSRNVKKVIRSAVPRSQSWRA